MREKIERIAFQACARDFATKVFLPTIGGLSFRLVHRDVSGPPQPERCTSQRSGGMHLEKAPADEWHHG